MNKYSFLAITLFLAACGSVNTYEESNDIKRIEYTDAPFIAFPPEAAYATQEVQSGMKVHAYKACPDGYKTLKEQYVPRKGQEKDRLVWYIKCSAGGK